MPGFAKSKSASTKCHYLHKVIVQLCFQEVCVPQFDRRQRKTVKAAEALSIGPPCRLTSCVNGPGFRRWTCLQPQECPAVRAWTLPLNLLSCFCVYCDEQVVNVSADDSIHSGVMKNKTACGGNSNKIILRPLTRGASGLQSPVSNATEQEQVQVKSSVRIVYNKCALCISGNENMNFSDFILIKSCTFQHNNLLSTCQMT